MTLSKGWLMAGGTVLALSLAGNLLLAGALIGRHVGGHPPLGVLRMLPDAPPAAKTALRDAFGDHRAEMREHFRSHHRARERVAEVLAAPEFDPTELDRALTDLAMATARLQTSAHAIVREAAVTMPPEARRQWGADWKRRRSHGPHRDKDRSGSD